MKSMPGGWGPLCFLACAGSACVASCSLCSPSDSIATLTSKTGLVESDRRDSRGHWTAAARGADLGMGDAIRTGESAHATLRLFDRSILELEPKTLVRFLERRSPRKPHGIDVRSGDAVLEVG